MSKNRFVTCLMSFLSGDQVGNRDKAVKVSLEIDPKKGVYRNEIVAAIAFKVHTEYVEAGGDPRMPSLDNEGEVIAGEFATREKTNGDVINLEVPWYAAEKYKVISGLVQRLKAEIESSEFSKDGENRLKLRRESSKTVWIKGMNPLIQLHRDEIESTYMLCPSTREVVECEFEIS